MNRITVEEMERFLREADGLFPVPLSQKQALGDLARKLCTLGTVCVRRENGAVCAALGGYTDRIENGLAYMSVLAVLPSAQGKGYASAVVREFISVCRSKGIPAVHLYTTAGNAAALRLYERLGFVPYEMEDEPRPGDIHLIYYVKA